MLQGIRNQVTEIGWAKFLINRITVWLLSQTLILSGSYVFVYRQLTESWMYTAALMTIVLGYFIKQNFYKPLASLSGSKNVFIYRGQQGSGFPENRDQFPQEKDVTPP
ncbi:hypothetical protein [Leptospira congkakensis]|uniref:hypothetical protein n=1 Tax=Leptospira congkakensis TaxID=2484932 RepID=UPI001FCC90CD|nr:hypothetical protein [Leptospira congkakensis]